jgi:hypothetical protein
MHTFPVYYVCNEFLHKYFFFRFPKKNNFMLVAPRTERYEGVLHIYNFCFMVVFPTAYYVNMSL